MLFAVLPALAQPPQHNKTLQRVVDPVMVNGAQLAQLIGKDIDYIRVFALRSGKFVAIPFQIDQRDSSGQWVWDVVYRKRFAFIDEESDAAHGKWQSATSGKGTVDDEDPVGSALVDANDVLVFMAEDAGDYSKAPQEGIDAPLILSLEVSDPLSGARGWVYVAAFSAPPPPLSQTRYMKYNAQKKTVESPIYSFHFSDEHMALIHNLQVNHVTVVDRIRVRGAITLSFPVPDRKLTFDEEDIHGHTVGYIAGPVRIVKRNIAHLSLVGGLVRAPEVTCDNFYYPHHAQIPVCLSTGFPIKQIAMTLTTDYRNPPFRNLYMGRAQAADSKSGVAESLQARLRRLGTEWIVLGGEEASLISLVVVPDTVQGQAWAQPCLCAGKEQPVRSRAVSGKPTETGFLITSSADCPEGEHVIYGSYLISAQSYEPGDEYAAFKMQHLQLKTHVSRVWPPP